MREQILILVDRQGRKQGYAARSECHTGRGRHHRAFVIALYNGKGEILLQKRKHKVFNNIWDLSAASHPLRLATRDETYADASSRTIKREWGASGIRFRKIGGFNYFKRYGQKCENEYCAVIIGKYEGRLRLNRSVAYGMRWASLARIRKEIKNAPNRYSIWAVKAVPFLKREKSLTGKER